MPLSLVNSISLSHIHLLHSWQNATIHITCTLQVASGSQAPHRKPTVSEMNIDKKIVCHPHRLLVTAGYKVRNMQCMQLIRKTANSESNLAPLFPHLPHNIYIHKHTTYCSKHLRAKVTIPSAECHHWFRVCGIYKTYSVHFGRY